VGAEWEVQCGVKVHGESEVGTRIREVRKSSDTSSGHWSTGCVEGCVGRRGVGGYFTRTVEVSHLSLSFSLSLSEKSSKSSSLHGPDLRRHEGVGE